MRKAIAIITFLSLFTQCIARLGIVGYYQLNKDYIAKNLCENRDKPKMKCCGRCYLRKQLKKVDDTETASKKAPVKAEKIELVVCVLPVPLSYATPLLPSSAAPIYAEPEARFNPGFPTSVFQPPAQAC